MTPSLFIYSFCAGGSDFGGKKVADGAVSLITRVSDFDSLQILLTLRIKWGLKGNKLSSEIDRWAEFSRSKLLYIYVHFRMLEAKVGQI